MRLSDLLGCEVRDEDGTALGEISDVRIVQDGPVRAGLQAGFRLDALVVGRGGLAERLGYIRSRVNGPWVLRTLFTRLEQRAHVVLATDVLAWDVSEGSVVVRRNIERAPLEP